MFGTDLGWGLDDLLNQPCVYSFDSVNPVNPDSADKPK